MISISAISRFWMCWGWEFIIFDERSIFLGPQGPTSTFLVPVEIELVPRFGLPSHSVLRLFLKTFDLVPGVQDSHGIDHL